MPLDKRLQRIEDRLLQHHRNWGWIVYRTTYGDDEKWARCNEAFQAFVLEPTLTIQGGTKHVQYLDFPVREDPVAFNNASAAELRAHFKTWRSSEEALEEQQVDRSQRQELWDSMRYRHFIRIDAESMQSILDEASNVPMARGWVDLIRVDWPESESDNGEEPSHGLTEKFQPLEDMTTLGEGFQRVYVDELYPVCWVHLDAAPDRINGRLPKTTKRLP